LSGLIDVAELEQTYDDNKSGSAVNRSESGRPQVGAMSGAGRHPQNGMQSNGCNGHDADVHGVVPKRTVPAHQSPTSYRSDTGRDPSPPWAAADG
jgi:hypothetical protein